MVPATSSPTLPRPLPFSPHAHYHAAFWHGITFNFRPRAPPEYLNTDFQPIKTLIFTPMIIITQPMSHSIRLPCQALMPTSPSSRILLIQRWKICHHRNGLYRSRNPYSPFYLLSNMITLLSRNSLVFLY